jgi:hypothetical protein
MADATEVPSAPAQTRVLATVELLELIFNAFDPIKLFAIQRVCKQWKGLIADSHRLQEHMFLRAPACNNKSKAKRQPATTCPTTTILANHSAEDYYYYCENENDAENDDSDVDPSSILLSPILTPATHYINTQTNQLAVSCAQTELLTGHPSWHNMYLSSPACKSATVALWWTLGDSMRGSVYLESLANPNPNHSADGERQDGLRFRDVVEAALAMRTGKWKRLPDGKVLPLSAVGRDICLGEFLEEAVRDDGDGEEVEGTSLFILSF